MAIHSKVACPGGRSDLGKTRRSATIKLTESWATIVRASSEVPDRSWEGYVQDAFAQLDSGNIAAAYDRFVRSFLQAEPRRILDVGTGPGQHLAAMSVLAPGAVLHGVDIDLEFLRRARAELAQRDIHAVLVAGDGPKLPYSNGKFDLVMSHLTLPYSWNDRAFLADCVRVLRPGGCLWLSTHGVGFFVVRIVHGPLYYRIRYLASLLAGALSMGVGVKLLKDTPVTMRWLRRFLPGVDVKKMECTHYGPWSRIITVAAVKPFRSNETDSPRDEKRLADHEVKAHPDST